MHCGPFFVYVTLLNFYLAALVKTFVKLSFWFSHKSRHCFQCTTMAEAQEVLLFLVGFYVINACYFR